MGVPTFYRWLCTKYPKVVQDVIEERETLCPETATFVPADLAAKNPNSEFDNLYIDMNGVVHPCSHPEDDGCSQPKTEAVMFQNVCDYIDRIVNIVRPRKLIYLALDGVAPRAKMNQQRSRRYKAAAEAEAADEAYLAVKAQFESEGREVPPPISRWDSNVITPGTPFMDKLSKVLRYYVAQRMETVGYWQSIRVLFSDSNVPGEGEHKVMSFVRIQRQMPNYDPNTRHVIHGMDADLIMLGLATHEPHFYILREVVVERGGAAASGLCGKCGAINHNREEECPRYGREEATWTEHKGSIPINKAFRATWKPLQFLRLSILREYLQHEFTFSEEELIRQDGDGIARVPSDLERHIDDFVLMCFFVGNDFLPHLPSLSIQKGSIDQMMTLYRAIYPNLGDYLTHEGVLNPNALKTFTKYLAEVEPAVLEEEFKRKLHYQRLRERDNMNSQDHNPHSQKRPRLSGEEHGSETPLLLTSREQKIDAFRAALQQQLKERTEVNDPDDPVELGRGSLHDYRGKYYKTKFHLGRDDDVEDTARNVSVAYTKGLQWVLFYYYQGVPSWNWFFPYYFSPLATDIFTFGFEHPAAKDLQNFDKGAPLQPLEQLLANLPPKSAKFLPDCFADLMLLSKSPLLDFYPKKFHEDPDGKRFRWQWVALLPFIDSNRLRQAASQRSRLLDSDSVKRNSLGTNYLFLSHLNQDHPRVQAKISKNNAKLKLSGLFGLVCMLDPTEMVTSEVCSLQVDGFTPFKSSCLIASFSDLSESKLIHRSVLNPGAQPPPSLLNPADLEPNGTAAGGGHRGPFNSTAAKRMILHVVGGPHLQKFLLDNNNSHRIGR